ncbi:MAG: hypothetical protein WBO46_25890, partial [Caldilineaceae bacterium]
MATNIALLASAGLVAVVPLLCLFYSARALFASFCPAVLTLFALDSLMNIKKAAWFKSSIADLYK